MLIILLLLSISCIADVTWSLKWHHPLKILSENEMLLLCDHTPDDYNSFNETLNNILFERVPDTPLHYQVNQYIISTMSSLEWIIDEDLFTANTPLGNKAFRNIIATLNPNACKRMVLACHYDSKAFNNIKFIGAIDSAVACAIIIEIAKSLKPYLDKHKTTKSDLTLQLVFFDGEEAFIRWSESDSLYGSRHLAYKWNKTKFASSRNDCRENLISEIDRIDLFMLLDLLGSANPNFYSHHPETDSLFEALIKIERKLNQLNLLEAHSNGHTIYFKNKRSFSTIEDDHKPFAKYGVPILLIIPIPFPRVWHTADDNRENLDHITIDNLIKIFKVFVAQYLGLNFFN